MTAWLTDFKFRPAGRYHISSKPIPRYYGTVEQGVEWKPVGLWYGCGDAWVDWVESEMPGSFEAARYLYEITPGPGVLYIRTLAELDAFSRRYGVSRYRDSGYGWRSDVVDWPRVARSYSGIEICPYQWKRRMEISWYYPWDVASGCLWGPDDHRLRLVDERPVPTHRRRRRRR